MRFGDLTYEEIRERAKQGWLAIVPTGCTEQQGPHLPVDFDAWIVGTVCLAAAKRAGAKHGVNALVLPAIPFGPTPEHRGYGSGYIHLPQELHEAVVSSVLDSLVEQGFRCIVVWCGEVADSMTWPAWSSGSMSRISARLEYSSLTSPITRYGVGSETPQHLGVTQTAMRRLLRYTCGLNRFVWSKSPIQRTSRLIGVTPIWTSVVTHPPG